MSGKYIVAALFFSARAGLLGRNHVDGDFVVRDPFWDCVMTRYDSRYWDDEEEVWVDCVDYHVKRYLRRVELKERVEGNGKD